METITFYSSKVFLSEEQNNPDSYIAKFVICDFGRNSNGVSLNRNTIEQWLSTLKNKPLVGKVKLRNDGEYDFSGHNVKIVEKTDEKGNKYQEVEFDTDAFGTFFDVGIETIDECEYIVATCEIWKRFNKACEIILKRIKNGTLHTSWEISAIDCTKKIVDGFITKVINVGRFIGHCLLGEYVEPAYNSSGLLEIASTKYDNELAVALSQDILCKESNIKAIDEEVNILKTKNDEKVISEKDKKVETSALTEWDLRDKIHEACRSKLGDYCYIFRHFPIDKTVWVEKNNRESELDYISFTYEVNENDEVTVSEPQEGKLAVNISEINSKFAELEKQVSEKDSALVKAGEKISSLNTEISTLQPFKEKFEKSEQERIEKETSEKKEQLISKYLKTGYITDEEIKVSSEIKGYFDSLDEKSLNNIVATRLMESLDGENSKKQNSKEKTPLTASANLMNNEDGLDEKTIIKRYLGGK